MKKPILFSDDETEEDQMDTAKLKNLYDLYWKLQSQYHCCVPGHKQAVYENIREIQKILSRHIHEVYSLASSGKM